MTAAFDSVFYVFFCFVLFCQFLFTDTEIKYICLGWMSDPLSDILL